MKVIYKTSMVGKINEKVYEAKLSGKEIDRIILTPDEWQDLQKELLLYQYIVPHSSEDQFILGDTLKGAVAKFKDIPIFVQ